jgi:serine/threonine protein kinase
MLLSLPIILLIVWLSVVSGADRPANTTPNTEEIERFMRDHTIDKILSPNHYYNYYILEKPAISSYGPSTLYRATGRGSEAGKVVAIKMIDEAKMPSEFQARAEREVRQLLFFRHPRIVRGERAWKSGSRFYVAIEWMDKGTLARFCHGYKGGAGRAEMPKRVGAAVFKQVLLALQYLHNQFNVIHRDIKPENVMFGGEPGGAKLIDLGLCTKIRTTDDLHGNPCGSPMFSPPEVYRVRVFGKPVDIYALGLTMLFTILDPLPGNEYMKIERFLAKLLEFNGPWADKLVRGELETYFERLLGSCVAGDPSDRPTVDTLLSLVDRVEEMATDAEVAAFINQH